MNLLTCIIAMVLVTSIKSDVKKPPPVILLNGLAGARMTATLNSKTAPHFYCEKNSHGKSIDLWVSAHELLPGVIECLFDNLALRYDSSTKQYSNKEGVTIEGSVDFGGVSGLDYLDPSIKASGYFEALIERLEHSLQYVVGENLRGAPYDWRLAPDGLSQKVQGAASELSYYDRLKTLIEETVASNKGLRVVIISHSMGGPVALAFLQKQTDSWKSKNIAGFMPISPPFAGAVSTVLALVSGDTLGVPIVSHAIFHPIQSTCASGPWLFPQKSLWNKDEILIQSANKIYTSNNYTQLTIDLGLKQAQEMFQDGVNELALSTFEPPNVRVEVLRGTGISTPVSYVYRDSFAPGVVPHAPTATVHAWTGDGTVNDRSLARALEWKTKQNASVRYWEFKNTSHFGILKSEEALDQVVDLLITFE